MPVARGNVGRLVAVDQPRAIAIGDPGHALHHDPVLAAVMVHLQRQALSRPDHDSLDLEARPLLEDGIAAPGTVDGPMQPIGLVPLVLQPLHHPAHLLDPVGAGDQQRIGSIHHDQVVDPDRGDQAPVALHEGVTGVDEQGVAAAAIALCVRVEQRAHRAPGTDIAPVEGRRHHGDPRGALHQRIVDGNVRQHGEGFARQLMLDAIGHLHRRTGGQAGPGLLQQGRGMLRQLVDQGRGRETEHPGVPQETATFHVATGGFLIGFLDEAAHLGRPLLVQPVAQLDIAETGFRCVRHHAEGNQVPGDGETRGMPHRLAEGLLVADQVIRRHHHQYRRVAMFGLQRQGGDGNRQAVLRPVGSRMKCPRCRPRRAAWNWSLLWK